MTSMCNLLPMESIPITYAGSLTRFRLKNPTGPYSNKLQYPDCYEPCRKWMVSDNYPQRLETIGQGTR